MFDGINFYNYKNLSKMKKEHFVFLIKFLLGELTFVDFKFYEGYNELVLIYAPNLSHSDRELLVKNDYYLLRCGDGFFIGKDTNARIYGIDFYNVNKIDKSNFLKDGKKLFES